MFRFTKRDALWLIAALLVPAAVFVMPSRRESRRPTPTRLAAEQDMEAIRARYAAARGEFDYHVARTIGSGVWPTADQYCASIERFAATSKNWRKKSSNLAAMMSATSTLRRRRS